MKKMFMMISMLWLTTMAIAQDKGDLTIHIEEVKDKGKGQVVFILFHQEDGFPRETEKAKFKEKVTDFQGTVSYTFKNLPHGNYAIAVFHDKNKNGEIDTNFIGMPKEPVAASNMKGMGRPTFKKSKIDFKEPKKSITLNFIND